MRPFRQPLLGHVLKHLVLFQWQRPGQREHAAGEGGSQCSSRTRVPSHQPGTLFPSQPWQSQHWGSPVPHASCLELSFGPATPSFLSPWSSSEQDKRWQSLLVPEGPWAMSVCPTLTVPSTGFPSAAAPRHDRQRDSGHGLRRGSPHGASAAGSNSGASRLACVFIEQIAQSCFCCKASGIESEDLASAARNTQLRVLQRSATAQGLRCLPCPRPHPCLLCHWSSFFPPEGILQQAEGRWKPPAAHEGSQGLSPALPASPAAGFSDGSCSDHPALP